MGDEQRRDTGTSNIGPDVDAVTADTIVPQVTDVIIFGGAAAFALARRGVSLVLVREQPHHGEPSSRNRGWVRKARRDPREIPLVPESPRM